MQSLIPLLLVGFVVYLVFFRKGGGMGCCGGHGSHETDGQGKMDSENPSSKTGEKVIDLKKDEYTIQ